MKHKVLIIALVSFVALAVFWVGPAFHEPADHTCPEDAEGSWSFKIQILAPGEWNCDPLGWHIGRYGFPGI
jgi:hypothetical protein